jgi:hypothetical protein
MYNNTFLTSNFMVFCFHHDSSVYLTYIFSHNLDFALFRITDLCNRKVGKASSFVDPYCVIFFPEAYKVHFIPIIKKK